LKARPGPFLRKKAQKSIEYKRAVPCEEGISITLMFHENGCFTGVGRDSHEATFNAEKKILAVVYDHEHAFGMLHFLYILQSSHSVSLQSSRI